MDEYLKRFFAALLWLGALAGTVLLIRELEGRWRWIVIPVLVGAAVYAGWRGLFDVIARIRNYPSLLERLARLDAELSRLREHNIRLESQSRAAFREGVSEGRNQIRGVLLAAFVDPPSITAVSERNGELFLAGAYKDKAIRVGARFEIEVSATGERKGTVEVVSVDEERKVVHLQRVGKSPNQFWDGLRTRAITDPTPPPGVRLSRSASSAGDIGKPKSLPPGTASS